MIVVDGQRSATCRCGVLGGGLEELASRGGVTDGGLLVEPEHGGEVKRVGPVGESLLELAERIRTGDVVSDLCRPLHFQGYWLAQGLGRAAYQAVARGVPPFLIGALFVRLRLPPDLATWMAFLVGLVLAVVVSFGYRFVVGLAGFWLLDNRGISQVAVLVMQFFAGAVVPLTFFPDTLGRVARVLPFACVLQLPVEIPQRRVLLDRGHHVLIAGGQEVRG